MMDKLKQFFDDRLGKFQHLIGRAELYEIIEAWNTRHPHQQEWVSVEDRLPEMGDVVLAFEPHCRVNDDKGLEVLMVDDEFDERKSDGSPWVSHWMPLPEPPCEESKEQS